MTASILIRMVPKSSGAEPVAGKYSPNAPTGQPISGCERYYGANGTIVFFYSTQRGAHRMKGVLKRGSDAASPFKPLRTPFTAQPVARFAAAEPRQGRR